MAAPVTIQEFLRLVRHGRIDNSYKMVWAKAIVDLATEDPNRTSIPLDAIAERVISYYWNLHIFFDPEGRTLRQGSNSSKPPEILQCVLGWIQDYKRIKTEYKPVFYERMTQADRSKLAISSSIVALLLKKDVRHRFLNLNGKSLALYDYKLDDDNLIVATDLCKQLSEYQDILHEAILFRWTQILEGFNRTTPRIAAKVRIMQDIKRRNSSLKKFNEWLLIENPMQTCALCGHKIKAAKDISVDHVIPWSFLYSDDIWNLSFTHNTCNSQKLNTPPSKSLIDEQQKRNQHLHSLITKNHQHKVGHKIFKELDFALEENLLTKMWVIYKG